DLLRTVGRSNSKLDLPPVDFRDLGLRGDQASSRGRGEMAYVDGSPDRALSGIEIGFDGIKRGIFHSHDHDWGGEYRWQGRVLEPVRKVLGLDEKVKGASGSNGYLPHGLPSNDRSINHWVKVIADRGHGRHPTSASPLGLIVEACQ